jgi:hypothetical protein
MMDRMNDDAALRMHAKELAAAIDAAVPHWIERLVHRYVPAADASAAAAAARTDVAAGLKTLIAEDVDAQRTTPLSVLRDATRHATAVLRAAGVAPVAREEFAVRAFPDDVYDLAPASFADVDESLVEPGLVWGAAKAHAHLERHRLPRIAAFVPDLMDRSRITAAVGDRVRFVRLYELAEVEADIAVVDLGRPEVFAVLSDVKARVIGFGSHVDRKLLRDAKAAGCNQVLVRSAFFGDLAHWLG